MKRGLSQLSQAIYPPLVVILVARSISPTEDLSRSLIVQPSHPTRFCSSAAKGSPAKRVNTSNIPSRLTYTADDEETDQPEGRAPPPTPPKPSVIHSGRKDMGIRTEESESDAATVVAE